MSNHIFKFSIIKILSFLSSILVFKINATYFNAEKYGLIAIILAILSLINAIFLSWLGYALFENFEKFKLSKKINNLINAYFFIFIIVNFLGAILLLSISSLYIKLDFSIGIILFLFHFANSLNIYTLLYLELDDNIKWFNIIGVLNSIGSLILLLFCTVLLDIGFYASFVPQIIVSILSIIILYKYKLISVNPIFDKKLTIEGFNFGWSLSLTSLGVVILAMADRIILEKYSNLTDVGKYSVVYRFGEMLISAPTTILSSSLIVIMYKIFREKGLEDATLRIIKNVEIYLFIVGLIFSIILYNPKFSLLIIGKKYANDTYFLYLIVLSNLLFGATQILANIFLLLNKQKVLSNFFFVVASLNIVLCFVLIPKFNLNGAAIATIIPYSIYFILVVIYINKLTNKYIILKVILNSTLPIMVVLMLYFIDILPNDKTIFNIVLKTLYIIIIYLSLYFFINRDFLKNLFKLIFLK